MLSEMTKVPRHLRASVISRIVATRLSDDYGEDLSGRKIEFTSHERSPSELSGVFGLDATPCSSRFNDVSTGCRNSPLLITGVRAG